MQIDGGERLSFNWKVNFLSKINFYCESRPIHTGNSCAAGPHKTSNSRLKTSCTVTVDKVKHPYFCCIICEFIFSC